MVGLAVLLGGFAAGIVVSIPLYLLDAPDALLVLAAGLGVYAPVAWYCWWVSRHDGTGDLGRDLGFRWKPIDLATGLGAWLAATVLQVAVLVVLQLLGLPLGTNTDTISDARDTPATLVVLALLAVVVAPIVEELLFRGLVLRSLRSRLGPWPAILVQGASRRHPRAARGGDREPHGHRGPHRRWGSCSASSPTTSAGSARPSSVTPSSTASPSPRVIVTG